jgi:hypothetical protein
MAWEGIKSAIPPALIQILIEKVISMIVPAAGAVLAIIEGLQAAWGTVSRVIQAFDRFMGFLKAVKTGQSGPQFGAALAAAGVVLIDFVSNWLLKRVRGAASKVAAKVKEIAKKIGRKLKAATKKLGGKFGKVKDKFFGKKEHKHGKHGGEKDKSAEKLQRLQKAMQAAQSDITKFSGKKVGKWILKARLFALKLQYRLKSLEPIQQGQHWTIRGEVNPILYANTDVLVLHNRHEAADLFLRQALEVEREFFDIGLSNQRGLLLPNNLEKQMHAAIRKRGQPPVERFQMEGVSSTDWIRATLAVTQREGSKVGKASLWQSWGDVKLTDSLNPTHTQPTNRKIGNLGTYERKGPAQQPGTLKILDQLRESGMSDFAISKVMEEASQSGKSVTAQMLNLYGHKGGKDIIKHSHRLTRSIHLNKHLEPTRFLDRGLSGKSQHPYAVINAMNHQMVQGGVLPLEAVLGRGEFQEELSPSQLLTAPLAHNPAALKGITQKDITITAIMERVRQSWSEWKRNTELDLVIKVQQGGVVDPQIIPTKAAMRQMLLKFYGKATH